MDSPSTASVSSKLPTNRVNCFFNRSFQAGLPRYRHVRPTTTADVGAGIDETTASAADGAQRYDITPVSVGSIETDSF